MYTCLQIFCLLVGQVQVFCHIQLACDIIYCYPWYSRYVRCEKKSKENNMNYVETLVENDPSKIKPLLDND